ncbi:MAG: transcription-repair coupling factor [Pseudoclavibacter sp.]|nr:transcription-repair coupling factor [Pseudoclavibacter sp.]
MTLHGLLTAMRDAGTFDRALGRAHGDADFSLPDGLRAPLLAALLAERHGQGPAPMLLAVTATGREAEELRGELAAFLPPQARLLELPAWETLPHERLSPSVETVGRRLAALHELGAWRRGEREAPFVLLVSVRAALQPFVPGLEDPPAVELAVGARGQDPARLAGELSGLGYARVDMVTRRGEFAVRGGILDVFPSDAAHAVRIDFFGDEIEEIRAFSVADQRSLDEETGSLRILPARELLPDEAVRRRAQEMLGAFPGLEQMLTRIAQGVPSEGMESLAPALAGPLVPITELLPQDAAVALVGPERIAARAVNLAATNREFLEAAWSAAAAGASTPVDLASGDYVTVDRLRQLAGGRPWWRLSPFRLDAAGTELAGPGPAGTDAVGTGGDGGQAADPQALRIEGTAVPSFAGDANGAVEHLAARLGEGWTVAVAGSGPGMRERAAQLLAERGLAARPVEHAAAEAVPGVAQLVAAELAHGFELPERRIAVLSEREFYGRAVGYDARRPKKLAHRRSGTVVDPLQLRAGDLVVHETHGIGRFVELRKREIKTGHRPGQSTTREYLVIEYAPSRRGKPGDKLFVPTDQLDQLTRYVGGEDPALSKMGGSDWAAQKSRARRAVRDIAVGLVKLYSARMAAPGHAFSPDTPWQREMEEAFPYAETRDQLQTIEEVKRDMERPVPMDRLLSGDVGFGKTEVAVRAAFKAVQDGKQVVVLVPTTLLVRQHLETFSERMAGFPVTIRPLSRFQSRAEAAETVRGLADGSVDVVIGTHRLLSEQIVFKDVGLVVIDEEQRFGVEHKDAIKKLKTNVDVLAMSATPIPRTLEMAVTGIREMSTLATPPEDRHPVLTFVGPRSDRQIAAAIRRELLREGQVFYVHNRVASIGRVAAHIAGLVPEARVAVAHGRLSESALEQVIVDFWERKFDVLVTTTIVETGLDIPNANTLVIDDAERYGLSQLHQLRGRVGRGRERAYAYFLYDGDRPLSETAQDRLETIAANNELGSGMQVALKDLELRGAGNLLGGEQSGHIAGVGFDLYLRMIGEAVASFRGEQPEERAELRLELPVDARMPEEYVSSERLRLEAYQKLSGASSPAARPEAVGLVAEELRDRYGEPPAEVLRLLEVSRLRRLAAGVGLREMVAVGRTLKLGPAELPESRRLRLARMYPQSRYTEANGALAIPLPTGPDGGPVPDEELLAWARGVLEAIFDARERTEPDPGGRALPDPAARGGA